MDNETRKELEDITEKLTDMVLFNKLHKGDTESVQDIIDKLTELSLN